MIYLRSCEEAQSPSQYFRIGSGSDLLYVILCVAVCFKYAMVFFRSCMCVVVGSFMWRASRDLANSMVLCLILCYLQDIEDHLV